MRHLIWIFMTINIAAQAQSDSVPAPGVIPVNYPVINSTQAKSGEFILAPSRAFIDKAFETGKPGMFIFYQSKMVNPDTLESIVKQVSSEVAIPNSLIVPIPAAQTAQKGDIVVTSWQSGSGMQRAIVVDDANPESPIAHYLDLTWDNPAKNKEGVPIGQMKEELKPGTFVVLNDEWQAGRSCIFKDAHAFKAGIIIHSTEDTVLILSSNFLIVQPTKSCFPIEPIKEFNPGDIVYVPLYGSYKQSTVVKYDKELGRVWVEVEFAGKPKEMVVSITEIVSRLPE